MITLGQKVRKLRIEWGYTLEHLALLSGSSKSYIYEIETNSNLEPSVYKIRALAEVLRVTVDYLINDRNNEVDAADEAFFNKYKCLSAIDQYRIRQITYIFNGRRSNELL